MERYFLYGGIAMCLFGLWAIGRHDWVRLTTGSRRVTAKVIGHRISDSDGAVTYAAIYRFTAEGADHDVTDQVYYATMRTEVGSSADLVFPVGRPELARLPRPWTWLMVYAALIYLGGVLVARLAGWIT